MSPEPVSAVCRAAMPCCHSSPFIPLFSAVSAFCSSYALSELNPRVYSLTHMFLIRVFHWDEGL